MEGLALEYFADQPVFPDRRLDMRLFDTFERMCQCPQGTLPRKLARRRELVGGYRLFNNRRVEPQAVLASHRLRCLERLANCRERVLLLHDTTVLDFSGLTMEGLGQVGDGHGQGLYAHHSLAVLPQSREVVGLLNQILHRRDRVPQGEKRSQRQARATRESRLWKRAVQELPALPAGVDVTDVSDRGSDLTEYLWYELQAGRQFIVRSQHNRRLAGSVGAEVTKLHDHLRSLAEMGRQVVTVSSPGGGRREATIALSYTAAAVAPPRQARGEHGREAMELWAVRAWEVTDADAAGAATPPGQAELLEGLLLTNRPLVGISQAQMVVQDYACRWMVEDFHKAQKTGCGIEHLQLTTRHGLDNAIAVLSVLAVHVLRLRCAARDPLTRDQPACRYEEPLKVQLAARTSGTQDWQAMTLWQFYLAVARLGGYMLNPHKRPPGWQVLWRGYIRLESMCEGARLMAERCVQT